MFIKYFIQLLKQFNGGFKRQISWLFIMSVISGFLELLGIAMIFPCILLLTSEKTPLGETIIAYCSKFLPNSSHIEIAFFFSIIMACVFLFKNLFMMYSIKEQNKFVKKWSDYVSEDVIKKVLYAPYKSLSKLTYGDKNTLLFSIVREISLNFVLRCIILLANGVVAFCILLLLFYKFTIPAFLSILFIVAYAFLENNFFKSKAKKLGEEGIELLNDFALGVNFIIESQKEIVISNKQDYFSNYLLSKTKNISDNFQKQISYGNYPLHVTEIGVILAFLIMMSSIVFMDNVSKTAIVSSLAVIALIVLRLVPQLNKVLISMYSINVVKQQVIWFLEKYDEISKFGYEEFKNLSKMKFEEKIELKDLSFSYDDEESLSNINLTINKGEFVGIIGASGAGKTTLADIISGVYLKDSGEFLVDGVKIERENLPSFQKNISFLPQQSIFLNDVVLKNVAFGICDKDIDIDRAKAALIKAGLDIDVNLSMDLSYGQKQRVALARAYYRDFEILILDEMTASLDVNSEIEVVQNVSKLKGEKTIIAIAHRLSTLKNCDKIVYLVDGKIKAVGTFDELRQKYSEINQMIAISSFD